MITEGSKKEDNKKSKFGIESLIIFLASGAFMQVHKEFLASSSETYWGVCVVNWIHQILHALIGMAIQIVLILLLIKIGSTALKEIRSRKE